MDLIVQEPANRELIQREAGNSLYLAISNRKICHLDNVEPLKQALRYAMVKVGLRAGNFPVEAEKALLIKHILENYSRHTAEEIKLAFDMAISGKLGLDQKEVVCYENFSCLYFSGIMNAYRTWASQEVKQEKENIEQRICTQEELDNLIRFDIETFYQRMRNGKIPAGIPEYFRPILSQDGMLKSGETMDQFFADRLNRQFVNIYVKE